MSDSSSESSDDDLLSSPVFAKKRPDRRTERAEKNKLDFFDSCLKGSNARTDVHRRIAEVDNEFREEEEDEDGEEEEENDGEDNNMEVDGGREHKKENGDGAPATGEKCAPSSSSSKPSDNNDGKENVQNQTTSSTKEESSTATAATAAAAPSTAIKSKSSSTTTSSSTKTSTTTKKKTTTTHNNPKSSTNINNEEAYWSKVAAFSLTNSKKTPNCNYNNTSNNIHSARRKLTDAVSGLMDYNSDETVTDDEDGMMAMMMKNGGGRLGMTREQMRSEAEAKSQGGSSSIGLRSVFVAVVAANCNAAAVGDAVGTTTRSTSTAAPTAFATRSQAITQLKSTITTIQRDDDDSQHNTPKSLLNPFIALLFQKKKKPRAAAQQQQRQAVFDEEDVWIKLPVIFQNNPILNNTVGIASSKKSTTTVAQGGGGMIPTSLIRWMYSCAISSYEVGGSVGTQCCRLLRTFIYNYLAHDDNTAEETEDNMNVDGAFLGGDNNSNKNNNMSFLHNLTWNDLTSCLVNDFGLWMGEGLPPPLKETDTAKGTTTTTGQEAEKEEKNGGTKKRARKEAHDVRTVDVTALKNVCLIWTAMFQQNLIRLRDATTPNLNADSSNDEQPAKQTTKFVPGDNASQVLAAITRITLDPNFFYSVNTTSSNSSGVILFELLQQMSVSLIKSVSCQFSSSSLPNKQMRREGGSVNGGDDATMIDANEDEASPSSDSAVVAVDVAEQWRKHTAQLMVQSCINLGPGAEDAADNDDVDGQLPLAMAVKKMYSAELNNTFLVEVALMKMHFAEQALWQCLKEEEDEDDDDDADEEEKTEDIDWNTKVNERMDYLCKGWDTKGDTAGATTAATNSDGRNQARDDLRHAMHALITAEVGFAHIDEESESFMNDHPHFLAAVLIAGECALAGACIFWNTQERGLYNNNNGDYEEESADENDPDSCEQQPNQQPVYTTQEKDAIYEIVSNIEDLCDTLKKECRAVIAYPHLRRAKEYLTRLSKRLSGTKGKSSKNKKMRRSQGSLDCYFRPSMSDSFRDTQDS